MRFAEFARKHPYEVRFIEFMPLDADRTWSRDRVLPNAEVRRLIHAAYPLKDMGRERHGTSRRWEFADGQGSIGFISPVSEPFCGDCNRIRVTAEGKLRTCLFSMTETDLRGPLRAGATDDELERDHPRRGVGEGAQAPRQRRGLRAAAAHHVADRRMKDFDEALALVLDGLEPLAARRVPLVDGRRPRARRRGARGDRPAALRPHRDGRLRGPRGGRRAGRRAARDRRPRRGRRRGLTLEPGTAARISTGAAIPPGADAVLRVEDTEARRRHGRRRPPRVSDGLHIRRRGEDVHAGDVLARPGDVLTVPRLSALASAGVGVVDVPRTPRVDLIVTGSELLTPGAPPEPGKIYESNSIAVGTLVQQAGALLVHYPPVARRPASAPRTSSSAGWRATS